MNTMKVILIAVVAFGTGCESLLEVERSPNAIPADAIDSETAFQSRLIGSASDFRAGAGAGVVYGGLFTDELMWSESFPRREEIERRAIDPANDILADDPYTNLQVGAKTSKDLQRDILAGKFPRFITGDIATAAELGQISLYSGYSRLYLADLFCTLAFDNKGPEMPSADVYKVAIEDFTRTIGATRASALIRNAAYVGRARARLQTGDKVGALADAKMVPVGFAYNLEYATSGPSNAVYSWTWGNRRLPVAVTFRAPKLDGTATVDPRVKVVDAGRPSFSGTDQLWAPSKYQQITSPLRIASWDEAQYIIAEIEGGDVARNIIRDMRTRNGVTMVWDPNKTATAQELLVKVIDEKVRTMVLEGFRMADMRRLYEVYKIDIFPTGPRFGTDTCMPLPNKERFNNPELLPT
jgi:hypothetical protein